jgi:hypothetical protein
MSQLAAFFKGSDTRLGLFYPEHCLIAIFPDLALAETARGKLRGAGFSEEEALATSGADLVKLVDEESGIFTFLMTELSRFFDTEAVYTDRDLADAKRGAAVLAVHCPDERTKKSAWQIIEPTTPLAARYYGTGGIEHLAGET